MKKPIILILAVTALLGCEHQDGKAGNDVSAAADNKLAAKAQSDDSLATNAEDSKSVIQTNGSVSMITSNQPGGESDGIILYNGGFGLDDVSFTYELLDGEDTNSIPTNSLINVGSTNSLLP